MCANKKFDYNCGFYKTQKLKSGIKNRKTKIINLKLNETKNYNLYKKKLCCSFIYKEKDKKSQTSSCKETILF